MIESTACRTEPHPWPGITWIMRPGGAHGARHALEIYVAGALVDVMVATPWSRAVLGGGRAVRDDEDRAVAWGRQTDDGPPEVAFRALPAARRIRPTAVAAVGRLFWVAVADGRFTSVMASHHGGEERFRLRRIRP